jgi:hypothetical protein
MTDLRGRLDRIADRVRARRSGAVHSPWLSRITGREVYMPAGTSWLDLVREVCAKDAEDGDRP